MTERFLSPTQPSKDEFARRLYTLMLGKGWRQSDLARQADLPRDSISVYMRAQSLPTSDNLRKLAQALDVSPDKLWHDTSGGNEIVDDTPGTMRLRIDRVVRLATATKILQLLEADAGAANESES